MCPLLFYCVCEAADEFRTLEVFEYVETIFSFFPPRNDMAICTNVSTSSYDCYRISTIAFPTSR